MLLLRLGYKGISHIAPKFRTTRGETKDHKGQRMADFAAGIFFLGNRPLVDALRLRFQRMNEAYHLSRSVIEIELSWAEHESHERAFEGEIECKKRESWGMTNPTEWQEVQD